MSNEELSNADDDENKSNDETTDKKGAGVKFPPPLIFVLLIIVGLALDYIWPLGMSIPGSAGVFGIVLVLFAVAVAGLINATFKRAGTAIEPWKPTSNIVTTGFYAWSRNPIYTGFCVFNIGLGISLNNLWVFLRCISLLSSEKKRISRKNLARNILPISARSGAGFKRSSAIWFAGKAWLAGLRLDRARPGCLESSLSDFETEGSRLSLTKFVFTKHFESLNAWFQTSG